MNAMIPLCLVFDKAPLLKTIDPPRSSYSFRVATHPFWITPEERTFFNSLGNHLLVFYKTAHQLYLDSVQGTAPTWISEYLDQGKPPAIVTYGRMTQNPLPGIIRPDLILTHPSDGMNGMIATELDSIPGGIGLTFELARPYGKDIIGGPDGMRDGFDQMIRTKAGHSPTLAIVISEESASYRPEMETLGKALNENGLKTFVVPPDAISFSEDSLFVDSDEGHQRISVLYRFFELFDLANVPQAHPMFHAAQNQQIVMTPPPAAHLEEKMLFALFHHPALKSFWINTMGGETTSFLMKLFPKTWILDPRKNIQSSLALQELIVQDRPLSSFNELGHLGQKGRRFVIKPSGFSEWAWGSRGVYVGHDLSEEEWNHRLQQALEFYTTPWVLQPFHKGARVTMEYRDGQTDSPIPMEGRVRLSPYYFVIGDNEVFLGGILATVCPLNKKLIHGMSEAIMAPCAVGNRDADII